MDWDWTMEVWVEEARLTVLLKLCMVEEGSILVYKTRLKQQNR